MSYHVTRLEFFGQSNRRVWIKPQLADPIERRIKELQLPRDARVRSLSCWPNTSGRELFVYQLPDGNLMYVLGNQVQLADGARVDGSGDLEKWAREAMASGDLVRATHCRVCNLGEPSAEPFRCPCDGPVNLSEWGVAQVIISNNCYSFARRARWCGDGQGSQPGDHESSNEEQIRAGLTHDGLLPATTAEVLGGPGDFVAFFLEGALNYHFLRLDGDHWTHMPNGHPAIACDAGGHPIPKDAVRTADLQQLRFRDYFRVPPNTRLTHCR